MVIVMVMVIRLILYTEGLRFFVVRAFVYLYIRPTVFVYSGLWNVKHYERAVFLKFILP